MWLQQASSVLIRVGVVPYTQGLTKVLHKCFSVSTALPPDIAFEELTQKLADKKVTLIDVRLPAELSQFGMIPNSKNISLQGLGQAILQPDDDFAALRGFSKPSLHQPLVVSCLAGVRARTAQLAFMGAGYTNVRVYVGSFEDWMEKNGEVVFPSVKE